MIAKTKMKQREHKRIVPTKNGYKPRIINRGNKKKILEARTLPDKKTLETLGFKGTGNAYKNPLKKGWMLPYLMAADYMTNQRWMFWGKSMLQMKITDPIPQIKWLSMPGTEGMNMLRKNIQHHQSISGHHGSRAAEDLIDWILWGMGANIMKEAPKIPDKTNRHWYENFNLEPLLKEPHDYMARILEEHQVKGAGWFATPIGVCQMMAEISSGERKSPWESAHDPCLGTGSMIMPLSNFSLNLSGQDISGLMVKAATINGYLYMPWLVKPFPQFMLLKLKKETQKDPKATLETVPSPGIMRGDSLRSPPTGGTKIGS